MSATTHHALVTAGIDVGSSAIKAVVARHRDDGTPEVLATAGDRIRRRDVHELTRRIFDQACARAGVPEDGFDYVASTGDGDAVPFRTGHFYSMTAHARGALHLVPDARAALDVGALHARAIRMDERGRVMAHRMTSQCASGSGQFLENIARYLGVALSDVGAISCSAGRSEPVSSICAVLAETDVINMVSRGISTAEILKGIHHSIAGRLVRLVRSVGAEGTVLVTGGLAQDVGLLERIEALANDDELGAGAPPLRVATHPEAAYAGAIGAALLGAYRHRQLRDSGRLPSRQSAV
ncbi:MAG: benzoyl-CoA reductase subunit D [Candidatus Eisenbacteria bacterium]